MTRITAEKRKEVLQLLQNKVNFTTICKKCKISRPSLNKIRKTLQESVNKSGDEVESLQSETESVNSETESLQSETETLPREIFLRGRRYQTESESGDEADKESENGNNVVRNYLARMQTRSTIQQEPIQARAPIQKPIQKSETPVQTPIQKPFQKEIQSDIQPETQAQSQSESKQAKITKITAYFKAFPMKVGPITGGVAVEQYIENLQAKNGGELDGILAAIRYRISNSGLSDGAHLAFITASRGVENIGCRFGLKLQGYADSMATNQNVRDILTEMSIEYLSEVALAPHKRLVLICGLQAYSVHTKNSTEDLLKNVLDQEVDESKFDNSKEKENEF